jgi:hypothetical protein
MPAFVISYVPNVENVDEVQVVKTVNEVLKLPYPYFPLKKFNYQAGGAVHITATVNNYQAVYIPNHDCELKVINLCFTSYNIEDTYDVWIGSRCIIKNSYVKEMSESRELEVYELVTANTPIVIEFNNNSGLEKYMMYDLVTLVDAAVVSSLNTFGWTFNWSDTIIQLGQLDTLALIINQPNYVNLESVISTFSLDIIDRTTQQTVATITCNANGVVSSTYNQNGYLAEVNVIAIQSVTRFGKNIQVLFKNTDVGGTVSPHNIEISISGSVTNILGGI